jgi:tetratricopeptide (TPR) repeat protein
MSALIRAFPKSANVQVLVGLTAMQKRDIGAARRAFETALTVDPRNHEALAGIVQLDLAKNPAAAEARVRAALNGAENDTRLLILLARTHVAGRNFAAAEQDLRRAITIDSTLLDPYTMLGRIYADQRKLPEALAEFNAVAAREPTSVPAHTAAAMILQMQNKPEEARKRYEKALELNPRAVFAANNLAYLYAQSGANLDIALQLAQAAKAQLPNHPDVNDTLGWIYALKDLPSLAIPPLTASTEADPSNAIYAYHLGVAYAKSGDKGRAKTELERAVKLGGDSPEAREAKRQLAAIG